MSINQREEKLRKLLSQIESRKRAAVSASQEGLDDMDDGLIFDAPIMVDSKSPPFSVDRPTSEFLGEESVVKRTESASMRSDSAFTRAPRLDDTPLQVPNDSDRPVAKSPEPLISYEETEISEPPVFNKSAVAIDNVSSIRPTPPRGIAFDGQILDSAPILPPNRPIAERVGSSLKKTESFSDLMESTLALRPKQS